METPARIIFNSNNSTLDCFIVAVEGDQVQLRTLALASTPDMFQLATGDGYRYVVNVTGRKGLTITGAISYQPTKNQKSTAELRTFLLRRIREIEAELADLRREIANRLPDEEQSTLP